MIQKVGVIGGGQLAQMLGLRAQQLGIDLFVQTPFTTDPGVAAATGVVLGAIDDLEATQDLAARTEVITFENEFVDLEGLQRLRRQGTRFRPDLTALEPLLDKATQRQFLQELDLPIPISRRLDDSTDLEAVAEQISFPAVLKARRHGYDGQGTQVITSVADLESILSHYPHTPWLLEQWIPFDRELAVVAARSATGEISIFPIVETQQEQQICHRVLIPAEIPESLQGQIQTLVGRILERLQVIGLFGIELFERDHQVMVNEISPRTHNSGHYSMEACQVSQFEQHLRAICDLPLGDPSLICGSAVMVNLLGWDRRGTNYGDRQEQLEQYPGATLHWYGKSESRPGRKLGHVTVCLEERADRRQLMQIAEELESIWYGDGD